jgi:hypothetical protein
METDDQIAIIVNRCFGGLRFSRRALDEYNQRSILADPNFEPVRWSHHIDREDPLMISICHELGKLVNSEYSKIKVKYIPHTYKDFYRIDNCDGKEFIIVEFEKYKLDLIQNIICNPDMDSNQKIIRIQSTLLLELEQDI